MEGWLCDENDCGCAQGRQQQAHEAQEPATVPSGRVEFVERRRVVIAAPRSSGEESEEDERAHGVDEDRDASVAERAVQGDGLRTPHGGGDVAREEMQRPDDRGEEHPDEALRWRRFGRHTASGKPTITATVSTTVAVVKYQ